MKVEMRHISKSFGKQMVLKDISLQLQDHRFTTLLGPSGCGKTTLLRIIAGLEQPDEGEIYFDDVCVFSKKRHIQVAAQHRHIGFVFQDFALWPHMSVFENVAFGLKATKQKEGLTQRVEAALASVKLSEYARRYPHELSGGQQQRVAFARAIATSPACILFDEPLSALDAILREEMRIEIKRLTNQLQMTSIFVTHDQKEAMMLSDVIVVMKDGEIIQQGNPEDIYFHPISSFVAGFIGEGNWLNEHSMVRIEHMKEASLKNAAGTRVQVSDCQFMGPGYELHVTCGDKEWTLHSEQRYQKEDELMICFDPQYIYKFQEELDV